jgi:hypothetical protein
MLHRAAAAVFAGRERERQRQRERVRARACARAVFGALGICARRNTVRAGRGGALLRQDETVARVPENQRCVST